MIKYRFKQVKGKAKHRLTRLEPVVRKTVELKDFAVSLSKRTGIPVADVVVLMEEAKVDIVNYLLNSCNVKLGDLGTYSVELKQNEQLKVVPHKVRFTPSDFFRRSLNNAELKEV